MAKTVMNTKPRQPGFTLVEMLVSMAVLVILLGIVTMVYQTSSVAVQKSNALTEVQQTFEAIRRQFQRDITGIRKDGYMVISGAELQNAQEVLPGGKIAADREDEA